MTTNYSLTKISSKLTDVIRQFGESYHYKKPLSVPCGECKTCCTGLTVQLHDFELNKGYQKRFSKKLNCYVLKQNKDKSCVYSNERGCSIHDRLPRTCYQFDCRHTALFNIRDPARPDIDAARQRWIFEIDNQELADYMKQYFYLGLKNIDKNNSDLMYLLIRQTLIAGYEKLQALEKEK